MLALSMHGAPQLADLLWSAAPYHVELVSIRTLKKRAHTFGCSNVHPPIGLYWSGCEPGLGIRPSGFDEVYARAGIRLPQNAERGLIQLQGASEAIDWVEKLTNATAVTDEKCRATTRYN